MTKISKYIVDEKVTALDKWIGSDVNNQNRTKNFTPKKLSEYFNESNSIGISDQVSFIYYGQFDNPRPIGSITLQGFEPSFSSIITVKVSEKNSGNQLVTSFLDTLIGTEVIISDLSNINLFGKYYLSSITQSISEPTFYDIDLQFIEGNGNFVDGNMYAIAFHSYVVENDKHYTHTQFSPSTIWEVNHNLNKFPSVTAVNSNNVVYFGNVTYTDENNLTIEFSAGFSGKAYIN